MFYLILLLYYLNFSQLQKIILSLYSVHNDSTDESQLHRVKKLILELVSVSNDLCMYTSILQYIDTTLSHKDYYISIYQFMYLCLVFESTKHYNTTYSQLNFPTHFPCRRLNVDE